MTMTVVDMSSSYSTYRAQIEAWKAAGQDTAMSGADAYLGTMIGDLANTLGEIGKGDLETQSRAVRDRLIPAMEELRRAADEAETVTAEKYWPFPTYAALLFGVE